MITLSGSAKQHNIYIYIYIYICVCVYSDTQHSNMTMCVHKSAVYVICE